MNKQFDKILRTYNKDKDISLIGPLAAMAERLEKQIFFITKSVSYAFICFPQFRTLSFSNKVHIVCYLIGREDQFISLLGPKKDKPFVVDTFTNHAYRIRNMFEADNLRVEIYPPIRLDSEHVRHDEAIEVIRESFENYRFIEIHHKSESYEEIISPEGFAEALQKEVRKPTGG